MDNTTCYGWAASKFDATMVNDATVGGLIHRTINGTLRVR